MAWITFIWHIFVLYIGGMSINDVMKMLLLIDKLSKDQVEELLLKGSVECEGQTLVLRDFQDNGRLKEPYRTAFVLKILGKTTGALLCALSLIDCEEGTYGRRIGQELGKDDNYIRQLLNVLEYMGILSSAGGKGKQKVFTLSEDLVILPRGQVMNLLKGEKVSVKSLIGRELEEGSIRLEELFSSLYDEWVNQIIHGEEREKFEVGQLIESMIKCGVVRTFTTSSSKRLRDERFLTFYDLLELLRRMRETLPLDRDGNVGSSDLTRVIQEELQKRDKTGELARRYRNYVHYRMRKQIITDQGNISIDFSTLKDLIEKKAHQKGIELSAKMRNLIAEDLITSLKGLPMTSFKDTFIDSFIDNLLEDKFLIFSSEDVMNRAETLMRIGERLLESARDMQQLDEGKAKEFAAEASLSVLSLLLLVQGEIPPQRLSLMGKAFLKKKGNESIFSLLVQDFSSLRKEKEIREREEFLRVENILKERFQALDVARFLEMYLKMVSIHAESNLKDFIEATEVISLIGKLLFWFRMRQMEVQ